MQTNIYQLPMRRKLKPFRLAYSVDDAVQIAKAIFRKKNRHNRGGCRHACH